MSIVLDALNKAQKEQQDGRSGRSFYREEFRALKKKYKYWIVALIVINLSIFIGGGTFVYYNSNMIKDYIKSMMAKPTDQVDPTEFEVHPESQSPSQLVQQTIEAPIESIAPEEDISENEEAEISIDKNYFAVKNGPTLKISGVMQDGDNSSVIIGEEFLLIGEEIDGVTIEKVTRRKLTVTYKGESYVIPI